MTMEATPMTEENARDAEQPKAADDETSNEDLSDDERLDDVSGAGGTYRTPRRAG